jgi:hypothetical protein
MAAITLRQGARVIEDSRRTRFASWAGQGPPGRALNFGDAFEGDLRLRDGARSFERASAKHTHGERPPLARKEHN